MMFRKCLAAISVLTLPAGAVGAVPQANWIAGIYTIASGPNQLPPAAANAFYIAWAVDRPGGAGFMVSDGTTWTSNAGPQGPAGANGNTILSGTGAPSAGIGNNGDFYVDVAATRMYGPKTSGIWGTGVSLIGPTGATGSTGAAGSAATVAVGTVSTLPAGSSATVSNAGTSSAAVLNFGIPTGATGATGNTGAAGAAATIAAGTVSTLSPGSSATVTNVGTSSAAVFNFGIPQGATGATGSAGVNAFGTPTARSLSLATAYQATTTSKPAIVSINLTSTANLSLTGGTTNSGTIYIGATSAVASGTGTAICQYTNASTGTLTVGLNTNAVAASTCTFALPTGWYWAVVQTSGTITITSAFDQSVG